MSGRHKADVSMTVSNVGVSCQSMDACGWIQKCLEVVEKEVGLIELWKLRGQGGSRECSGDTPYTGGRGAGEALKYSGIPSMCKS